MCLEHQKKIFFFHTNEQWSPLYIYKMPCLIVCNPKVHLAFLDTSYEKCPIVKNWDETEMTYLSILAWGQGIPWTTCLFIAGLTYRDKLPSTPTDNLEWQINLSPSLHVFWLWEEAGVPRWNSSRHRNMENSKQKHPDLESHPGTSCCEATLLTNAPLWP